MALGAELRHAAAAEPELPSGLRPRRDPEEHRPLRRPNRHLGAEEGFLEGDRQLALEVRALAGEGRVGALADDDVEIATARPLAGQADPCAAVRPGRDRDLESLAVDVDEASRPVEGLVERDLGLRLVPGLRSGTSRARRRAAAAGLHARPHPGEEILEVDRPGAAAGSSGAGAGAGHVGEPALSSEEHAEEVRELPGVAARAELVADVAGLAGLAARPAKAREPGERIAAGPRTGPAERLPVRPERVVLLALVRVAEHRVGLVDVLESAVRRGVTGLGVGMVLPCQLPVRLLDLGL